MVAKYVVPVGQQVVGFNKLKDSRVQQGTSEGAVGKEMMLLPSSSTRQ